MVTFSDFFCGIGGFRIAFESVGAKCVFSADNDRYACETYLQNFNEYPLIDVTKLDEKLIPDFDIMCAGFPCQPFSIGGLRKGFHDTRGTLFFDIERIIRAKKPKSFILENVKGLTNHNEGKTLKVILNKLAKTINGVNNDNRFDDCLNYHLFYKVVNSKKFGVPQNRERIYIIGFDHKVNFSFPILNKEQSINEIIDKSQLTNSISKIQEDNINHFLKQHKNYNTIKELDYLLAYEVRKSRCSFRFDNLAPTLTAKMGTGGNNVPVIVKYMRRLTTSECLKIQGFPETYKIKTNNSQSYKQIGNSVSVPVITALAKEILKFI